MEIDAIHPDDWNPKAPPLQQSRGYGLAMAALGARPRHWQTEAGPVQGIARRGLRLIQRAGLTAGAARALARHWGATLVTDPLHGRGLLPLVTARWHVEWDLTPDPADLLAGMQGKWRNALRQGQARGAPIGRNAPRALADLLGQEADQARRRGYRGLPPGFLHHWGEDRLLLHHYRQGRLCAAMLFLIHGAAATYHIGWAAPEGRQAQAHRLMLWQAALDLRARGVLRLDLGPVEASAPGLARFKLGTGARMVPLGPTSLVLPI